jgi:hypothetical protein
MAYVRVDDPFLNTDKPGRSADWKQIRDNQDYFNSQIDTLTLRNLISNGSIADDFCTNSLGPWWTTSVGAGDTLTVIDDHKLQLLTNGNAVGDFAVIGAANGYQRIKKSHEYVAVCEARIKRTGTNASHYRFGWSQEAVLEDSVNLSQNQVNVYRDAFGGWSFETRNGGTGGNSYGTFGTAANWERIRLEFTCSATAGNRKIEIYLNDALQSTQTTDSAMPTGLLRPFAGCRGDTTGAASREFWLDYIIFTWKARPLAA